MEEVSQETGDAIATRIMQRMALAGQYGPFMDSIPAADREAIEDGMERHGKRMREKGEPGW